MSKLKNKAIVHEWKIIEAAINDAKGNKTIAAKALGINRKTLYNKNKSYIKIMQSL